LIGYVDRFSARPRERIAVKVSSRLAEPYRADLRIIHGDANPAGPSLKFEEVEATFAGTYPSRFQPAHSGSYGIVTRDQAIPLPDPCTIVVRVQPWLPDARRQTVLAIVGGPTLWVTAEGAGLTFGARELRVAAPVLKRRWYELRMVAEAGRARLRQTALQRSWGARRGQVTIVRNKYMVGGFSCLAESPYFTLPIKTDENWQTPPAYCRTTRAWSQPY
jgi:N,N-dimethylformamidase